MIFAPTASSACRGASDKSKNRKPTPRRKTGIQIKRRGAIVTSTACGCWPKWSRCSKKAPQPGAPVFPQSTKACERQLVVSCDIECATVSGQWSWRRRQVAGVARCPVRGDIGEGGMEIRPGVVIALVRLFPGLTPPWAWALTARRPPIFRELARICAGRAAAIFLRGF